MVQAHAGQSIRRRTWTTGVRHRRCQTPWDTVTLMSEMRPGAETRRFGRTASLLSAGVGVAGLLTYLFFSLASHNLDCDRVRRDRGPLVGRVRDHLRRVQAGRAAPVAHSRRPHRPRRGHRAGDPHRRADSADGLGRACRRDPSAPRPASRQPSLRLGNALLGAVRFRRLLRRLVLSPGLPRRDSPLQPPGGSAWCRSRRPGRCARLPSRWASPKARRPSRLVSRQRRW